MRGNKIKKQTNKTKEGRGEGEDKKKTDSKDGRAKKVEERTMQQKR